MRTTLNIDDDVLAVARSLAERNRCSLGRALSELARRGFSDVKRVASDDGLPVFRIPAAAGPITNEDVTRALSDWP